jgi:hypothetical protein
MSILPGIEAKDREMSVTLLLKLQKSLRSARSQKLQHKNISINDISAKFPRKYAKTIEFTAICKG